MRAQGTRRGRQPVSQEEEISHLRQTNANLTLWLWDGGWDPRILLPELNSQAVPGGLKVTSDRVTLALPRKITGQEKPED